VRVRVRLFASLREVLGQAERGLELQDGATAEEAWQALVREAPSLSARRPSLAVAVNREYAGFDARLKDGDELAFIPPVSGG
jgi:molybdopterin converting factor subunit 1